MRLQVRSRDNAVLGGHVEHELEADGSFEFEPVLLRIAGQEFSKRYFLLLYFLHEESAATVWAADYPRGLLGGPIELQCDLGRSELEGPPCRFIGDAADQPWLLAAGARDYQEFCAGCHGTEARLGALTAGGQSSAPPDLTKIAARRGGDFPAEEIAQSIDGRRDAAAHGPRDMPVWGVKLAELYVPGGFTQARIRNRIDILVEYLETVQSP
jgi:hypothetical protein